MNDFQHAFRRSGVPLLSALALGAGWCGAATVRGAAPHVCAPVSSVRRFGELPLRFEKNCGQTAKQVKFAARGGGYTLFLTPQEAVLALRSGGPAAGTAKLRTAPERPQRGAVLRMKLQGANPAPEVTGTDPLACRVSYLLGNDPSRWRSNIPTYAGVRYRQVYPGIDAVYYGREGALEYDFQVAPGANPDAIRCVVRGAERMAVDGKGDLVLRAGGGELRQPLPTAYQEVDGRRTRVEARYALCGDGAFGFKLGEYDRSRPLIIDPQVNWGTYFGRGGEDAYAVSQSVIAGRASSTLLPTTTGAFQAGNAGGYDAFIAEFNPGGSQLLYCTYLGGGGNDVIYGMQTDYFSTNQVWVVGGTSSTNFPLTASARQRVYGQGARDGFVAAVVLGQTDVPRQQLVYSSYLGGSGDDVAAAIAMDGQANLYVSGTTGSSDFPRLNAAQASYGGGTSDAFLAKFGPGAGSLTYSTFVGGTGNDFGNAVAADNNGNAYVAGQAGTGFPGASPSPTGAFMARFNATGGAVNRKVLGGNGTDTANGIALDFNGHIYLAGSTTSTTFPVMNPIIAGSGPPYYYGNALHGGQDAFLTVINDSDLQVPFSTYFGGSGGDTANCLSLSGLPGHVYIGGSTSSSDLPRGYDTAGSYAGGGDGMVALIDTTSSQLCGTSTSLIAAGYYGGQGGDVIYAMNGLLVAGTTSSQGGITGGTPYQGTLLGGSNAFLASLSFVPPMPTLPAPVITSVTGSANLAYNDVNWTYNGPTTGVILELHRYDDCFEPQEKVIYTASALSGVTNYTFRDYGSGGFGFSPLVTYTYFVVAVGCNVRSPNSNLYPFKEPNTAPSAPTGLAVVNFGTNFASLWWNDNSTNEDYFTVERQENGGAFHVVASPSRASTLPCTGVFTWTDTTLTSGVTYSYRVRAHSTFNGGTFSAYSNTVTFTTAGVPAAPTNLLAYAVSNHEVSLLWNDNSSNEDKFYIERSLDGINFALYDLVDANVASYTDVNAPVNAPVSYRVRAHNSLGFSAYSNIASANTTVPGTPYNLTATVVSESEIQLQWTLGTPPGNSVAVERANTVNGVVNRVTLIVTQFAAVSYSDHTVQPGIIYTYRVKAYNGYLGSGYSNEASEVTLPNQVTGLTVTPDMTNPSTRLNLSWVNHTSLPSPSIQVLRAPASGTPWTPLATLSGSAVSYQDTNLSEGTTYKYRIDTTAAGATSSSNTVAGTTAPLAPSNLTVTANPFQPSTALDLSWTNNSQVNPMFSVERSTNNVNFTVVGTVLAGTTHTDTGLTPATIYYYRVKAFVSGSYSAPSAVVLRATGPPAPVIEATVPSAPSTSTAVSWYGYTGGFQSMSIERSTNGGTTWSYVGSANYPTRIFTDTGLTPNTTYSYRASAFNGTAFSTYSNVVQASTGPVAPTNLVATAISDTRIDLGWQNPDPGHTTGFRVLRSNVSGGGYVVVATVSGNATTYSDTGLMSNSHYYYRVQTTGANANSTQTNEATAETYEVPTPVLTAKVSSNSNVNLSWTSVGADHYELQISTDQVTWTHRKTVNGLSTSDGTVNHGNTYYYRVQGIDANNFPISGWGYAGADVFAPVAPDTLIAVPGNASGEIDLTWTCSQLGLQGFSIRRSGNGVDFTEIDTVPQGTFTFTDTGRMAGKTYYYRVRAYNGINNSPASPTASSLPKP